MKKWKIPQIFKADAEKVSEEIKSIGDEVNPSDLLDYAKGNPDSELYKCFEWDDSVAAEKYRLDQARKVLRFIIEVPDKPEVPSFREFSLVETESGETTYKPTALIYTNSSERADLLARAKKELQAFREKYKTLTELKDVFDAIDEL